VAGEFKFEYGSCTMQARLDCALGQVENAGCLFDAQTLKVDERYDGLMLRSEAGEGRVEPIRYIIGFVRWLTDRHTPKDSPANPITPGEGIGLVGGDAEKLGAQRHACGLVAGQGLPSGEECVAGKVFGEVLIPCAPIQVPGNGRKVLAVDGIKCLCRGGGTRAAGRR